MPKLSIVIPARHEPHLIQTIDDIFAKVANPDLQVVTVLDGYWPSMWADAVERSQGRLITIHNTEPKGMRAAINSAVDISHGCEFVLKTDAHCLFSPGFDAALMSACSDHEVIVPRRYRLNLEQWAILQDGRPPVDYEYLTPPDSETGGLKGKAWNERAKERASVLIDETPLTQGSAWLMKRSYFEFLDLLDEENFGTFWKEMLEVALKAYLSGGRIRTHKGCFYAHPHVKRTYKLDSAEHVKAHEYSKKWLTDSSGWTKQTLPFSSFISRFDMPSWPK